MRKTYFEVVYDLKDTTALEDSTPSTLDNIFFANEYLLKNNTPFPKYATVERDYFLLDGSFEEFPDSTEGIDIPFWSSPLSDENGNFQKRPVLTILFSENHTSTGLTFHFREDYPLLMSIRWYDLKGELLSIQAYEPDSVDFYARNLVSNYGRIEIEFYKTLPYHYVKLYGIEYGVVVTWGEEDIKSASLTEEIDPVSSTLKYNKLSFQFVDKSNEFSLSDSGGLHRSLQRKQHIAPYEIVNGQRVLLGRYFLSEQSNAQSVIKMDAVDYIGLLDDTDFTDGRVYDGDTAGTIISEIFNGTGIPYEVDADIAKIPLYGWLKIQTRRNALKEVLFACGAVAETSYRENVRIKKIQRDIVRTVGRARKFSTEIKKGEYISEVNVKITGYAEGNAEKEIVKKTTYPAGTNEVRFSNPVSSVRLSAGTLRQAKTNYIIFDLTEETEVTVYGVQYEKQDTTATAKIEHLDAGQNPKSKTYTSALADFSQAKKIAESILDYYRVDIVINAKYLSDYERPGEWYGIENTMANRGGYAAGLESAKTDLAGGFVTTAQFRGMYKYDADYYRAGEIYAAEDVGVL